MTDVLLAILANGWTPAGLTALILAFILGGLVPVPRTAMVLAAGLVFGMPAVPLIVLSSTAGSVLAFQLGRTLARKPARRWLARQRFTSALLRAVDLEGWRIVALLRFYGPVPTTVQNYAFALTRIGLWPFTLTTLVFSVPQTAVYCYLGSIGQQAMRGELSGAMAYAPALAAVSCITTVVVLVGRRVRAILRAADAAGFAAAEA